MGLAKLNTDSGRRQEEEAGGRKIIGHISIDIS
jgi:hypothetical protein